MEYSISKFVSDVSNSSPRPFDIYVLPAFIMFYAFKGRKSGMPKVASRMLFGAGLWMGLRNLQKYKELIQALKSYATGAKPAIEPVPEENI